jgi:hypothetical protein
MRTLEKEQDTSAVLFEGEKARQLIDVRKDIDQKTEEICQELHTAFELAEERFRQLSIQYRPEFEKILAGTELEGTPITMIGLDYSKSEKYGIVFGQPLTIDPVQAMFKTLASVVNHRSSYPGREDIVFEKRTDFSSEWGADQTASQKKELADA